MKQIKETLKLIHGENLEVIEIKSHLVIATLTNKSKWIVDTSNNNRIDVWIKDENNELVNSFITMQLHNFKQWDMVA